MNDETLQIIIANIQEDNREMKAELKQIKEFAYELKSITTWIEDHKKLHMAQEAEAKRRNWQMWTIIIGLGVSVIAQFLTKAFI